MSQKRTADESNDDDDDVNDGSRKTPKLTRNGLHTEEEPFKPEPIDTSNVSLVQSWFVLICFRSFPLIPLQIELPESILELRDCIAQSIHENWSVNKVDAGYKWGEVCRETPAQTFALFYKEAFKKHMLLFLHRRGTTPRRRTRAFANTTS